MWLDLPDGIPDSKCARSAGGIARSACESAENGSPEEVGEGAHRAAICCGSVAPGSPKN